MKKDLFLLVTLEVIRNFLLGLEDVRIVVEHGAEHVEQWQAACHADVLAKVVDSALFADILTAFRAFADCVCFRVVIALYGKTSSDICSLVLEQ